MNLFALTLTPFISPLHNPKQTHLNLSSNLNCENHISEIEGNSYPPRFAKRMNVLNSMSRQKPMSMSGFNLFVVIKRKCIKIGLRVYSRLNTRGTRSVFWLLKHTVPKMSGKTLGSLTVETPNKKFRVRVLTRV